MANSDSDQNDPNSPPRSDQEPPHDMDNRIQILDTLDDHQNRLIELFDNRTALMSNFNAVLKRVNAADSRMDAVEQRLRNPFAGLVPLGVQLRNAHQNPADGTMSITLTVSHPQAQVNPSNTQPATAGPSTTGQGAVNTAGRQNNANRPTAAGNIQPSARSDAAQEGQAGSSRATRDREIKESQENEEEPAASLFPGSQNRTDAEIERDLRDRENDRTLGTAPLPQTSQDVLEDLYGDSNDKQTQPQNTRDGKKPSSQQGKKGRKPAPTGKNADGNDQAAHGAPERRRSVRFSRSEELSKQQNASSTNRNSQQPTEDATTPGPQDDGENITVRHTRSSVGGVRPRGAATGRLSKIGEHPEASGATNSGDDGREPASAARPKRKRTTAEETPVEDAEDVEDDETSLSPKKQKRAKGKAKVTKSKQAEVDEGERQRERQRDDVLGFNFPRYGRQSKYQS